MLVSKNQASFSSVSTLPQYSVIASDKKNNTVSHATEMFSSHSRIASHQVFYGASGALFYVSTDGGATFRSTATLGSSTAPVKISARWDKAGDLWVSTDKGLYHSTNYGTSFTTVSTITQAWHHGLGAPATSGGYPAVYVSGESICAKFILFTRLTIMKRSSVASMDTIAQRTRARPGLKSTTLLTALVPQTSASLEIRANTAGKQTRCIQRRILKRICSQRLHLWRWPRRVGWCAIGRNDNDKHHYHYHGAYFTPLRYV